MAVLIINEDQIYDTPDGGFDFDNGGAYSGIYLRRDILIASRYRDGMRIVESGENFKFRLVIDGLVQGGVAGLNAVNEQGSLNVVLNSQASVSGFGENGLYLNASAMTVTNAGEIWGATNGILFDHLGATTISITNTGRIEGVESGIATSGAGLVVLTNSGTIIGAPSGGSSFFRSQGVDADGVTHIYNTGTMVGDIVLNAGNDIYDGRGGAVLEGEIYGNAGADIIYGGAEDNSIFGGEDNDHLEGGGGNDFLRGQSGADYLAGGAGNDTYQIDDGIGDIVDEALVGSDGVDTIISYGSVDLNDTTRFKGAIENVEGRLSFAMNITGNALNNILTGSFGANIIDGGAGIDIMTGDKGNDTFIVDNAADKVIELANQDTDTVKTSVSYTLGASAYVETLQTTLQSGSAPINLTGNNLSQLIVGNAGANRIGGLGDNDMIFGLGGNDTLTGGAGKDSFYFNTALNAASNVDKITDFSPTDDTMKLSKTIFTALSTGTLSPDAFWASTAGIAHDATDRIIYDTDSGRLFYDADGDGAGFAIQFAVVGINLALTNADFTMS